MISKVAFQTKARTVDHLGREQIADTPTAVSELWKNAFDAYARNVALDLYDGPSPVAVIGDDGHGMSQDEFVGRWLVVGTESKATNQRTPIDDRGGLPLRPRLGQKGIGRLSCANLGPVLLLTSKRREQPFVAALIDWRLFENPFLNLSDIQIPVTGYERREQLFERLPELTADLARNLTDDADEERDKRLRAAWQAYDGLYEEDREAGVTNKLGTPSKELERAISELAFEPRHLEQWPVWNGASEQGTALLVGEINYDLRVEVDMQTADAAAKAARERFFETLSSFVDPFVDTARQGMEPAVSVDFKYAVRAWRGEAMSLIVGADKQFNRQELNGLEHQITGSVDENGVFTGRVKAFGEWLEEPCRIEPPKDLDIPMRADTKVGGFSLYIASMEFERSNSSLSEELFERYSALAKRYAGFMIFRDGLRVLPYGRTDNDFFEIEERRSKSAGREFWNNRQMFGRLAITRETNPNLKDKAGREGLLDNRAAKTLKLIVDNILTRSARLYFGSASDIRKRVLPQLKASNRAERAAAERAKLQTRQRREFRSRLEEAAAKMPSVVKDLERFSQTIEIKADRDIPAAQARLERLKDQLGDYRLAAVPKTLGSLRDKYAAYNDYMASASVLVETATAEIERQIERIDPAEPRALLEQQLARLSSQLTERIQDWKRRIEELQRAEYERVRTLVAERSRAFTDEASPLLAAFDRNDLSFAEAAKRLEQEKSRVDGENADIFRPYIAALESLKESIDLEHLAAFGMDEVNDMRVELERLNSLAQLGIAVEIVGHELQAFDDIIGSGLRRLPPEVRDGKAAKDIEFGYDGLTDQLRFLSPLRLAGQRIQRWITGKELAGYIAEFFKLQLANNRIALTVTPEFEKLRIFDQQSRLYPVFINLMNNSIYWVAASGRSDRHIVLDVIDGEAVISDNGPGIDPSDVESLFTLFFTRKSRGGRGVGLYLSRANLAAGGHRIRFVPPSAETPLDGATFAIAFQGAEFDGE